MLTLKSVKILVPMYALIIALAIVAIATPGCTPDEGDTYIYEGDTVVIVEGDEDNGEGDADEAPTDDDDSPEDSESDDDDSASDDDDSAIEEEPEELITVSINFTTVWSAAIPFQVDPTEEVNFGAWTLDTDGGDVDVTEMNFRFMFLDEVEIGNPFTGSPAADIVDEYIDSCVFRHVTTGTVISGPAYPEGGVVSFIDDFRLFEDEGFSANIKCQLSGRQPDGYSDALAVKMFTPQMNLVVYGVDSDNVAVEQTSTNGTDYWPTLFAEVVNAEELETVATVSLVGSAPLTVVRGEEEAFFGTYQIEVTAGEGDKLLTELHFDIAGDDDADIATGVQNDLNVLDHVEFCWLMMGSPISSSAPVDSLGNLDFTGLNQVIPEASPVQIDLYCSMALTPLGSGDADRYVPFLISGSSVELEDLNTGDAVDWDSIVFAGVAPTVLNGDAAFYVHVVDHGDIYLGISGVTPGGALVPSATNAVAIFEGAAVYEDSLVQELAFDFDTDNMAMVESVSIEYVDVTGSIRTQYSFPVPGQPVVFSGMSWLIEDSTWSNLTVNVTLDSDAQSGNEVTVSLLPNVQFGAVGMTSGHAFSAASLPSTPIQAYTMTVP